MDKITLYFTKLFTSGPLKGLTYNDTLSWPKDGGLKSAMTYVEKGKAGIRYRSTGMSNWKLVDYSFQKYWRD